ncbi:hypothetical protein [Pseudomonas avellanae]|uniref:hypothetical protein n=1 Tax=Pseudomonas avellanae TaxID=46257 RepID=UPI0004626B45|nr:hypothetical protein [Pseudomonas avellanae]UQW71261.1 Yae1 family protein [Pseudomonas avellanae]GGJ32460.1 hypothetical protein GCM10009085_28040 [Pseudomonas avellanae]
MSYDFNAETTGVIIGRRQGYQKGRNEGYDAGFEDANSQWIEVNNKWKAGYAALQKENANLLVTIQEANYAISSLSIISMSTMEVLKNAPQDTITKLVLHYYDLSKNWLSGKHIRVLPADEPVLQELTPHTVALMKKWWDQTVETAKPATPNNKGDSDPSL